MCLVRSILANLCPIKIHFNALDFSVCRSEEVMFLLTLSVFSFLVNPIPIGLFRGLESIGGGG